MKKNKIALNELFYVYREHKMCCIPIAHASKSPAVSTWKRYQDEYPSDQDCAIWGGQLELGLVGLALVCGPISGITALDLDSEDHYNLVPRGQVQKRGARGETRFFAYNNEKSEYITPAGQSDDPGVEVKAKGHYTVLPPSIHPAGHPYVWGDKELIGTELDPLPGGLLDEIRKAWGRTIQNTESVAARLGLSLLDAANMLSFIDCASLNHDDWLAVGMGLHYEFGAEAWQIFDSWSKLDAKRYNAEQNHKRWLSFSQNRDRKVTLNTVAHFATLGGWKELCEITINTTDVKEAERFPVPALPDSLLYAAPGLLRRLMDDMCRCAPVPNPHMSFGCALATLGAIKSFRIRTRTGLRPNLLVAGISGSGTGKEAPMSYVKKLFSMIAEQGTPLTKWLVNNLASGQGLVSALKDKKRLILWDELGQYLYQAVSSTTVSSNNILTRITEISTKADTYYLTDAYANHDGSQTIEQIVNPHLNLFGATNYKDLFRAIEAVDFGAGTWARMLFVFGPAWADTAPNFLGRELDIDIMSDIVNWIHRAPINFAQTKVVELSVEGERFLAEKWKELAVRNRKSPEFHHEFLNRVIERTVQVALVATDDYSKPIGQEALSWAYTTVDWLTTNFIERVVPLFCARSESEKVRQSVSRALNDHTAMSKSDILRVLRAYTTKQIDQALERLIEEGVVEVALKQDQKGSGRRKTVFQAVKQTVQ